MGRLQCKYCGEPVDVKTGACTACGKYVDSVTHARIVNMDELAREYGYVDDAGAEILPEIFADDSRPVDDVLPELLTGQSDKKNAPAQESSGESEYSGSRLSYLSGYLQRLNVAAGKKAEHYDVVSEPEQAYMVERTIMQKAELERRAETADIAVAEEPAPEQPAEEPTELPLPEPESGSEPDSDPLPGISDDEETDVDIKESMPVWMRGVYTSLWENGLRRAYMKIDSLLSPVTERVVGWFRKRFPMPNRAKGNPLLDRMAVIAAGAVAVVLLIALVVGVISLFPDNLRGEWMVSEQLSVEFSPGGKVTSWVYVDGEPRVEREGRYTVRRSNGYNLLTITYEDGVERRLYYEIEGDTGTFINVDTNMQAEYTRA